MKIRFMSLASGSSGNCYYLGTDTYGFLIDAGIGIRTIKKRLKDVGVPMENIVAVFVTHDHADHIKSVGVLGENLFLLILMICLKLLKVSCSKYIKMKSLLMRP